MSKEQGHREAARRGWRVEPPTPDPPEKPAKRRASDGRAEAVRRFAAKSHDASKEN